MKKIRILLICTAFAIIGCSDNATPSVEGSWVEQNPIAPEQVQGITLNADGSASSINMATLRYHTWEQKGDTLTLTLESEGSGSPLSLTVKYIITKVDKDSLILTSKYGALRYRRQEE